MVFGYRWVKILASVIPMVFAGLSYPSYGVETSESSESELTEPYTTGDLRLVEEITGHIPIDAKIDINLQQPVVDGTTNVVERILSTINEFDPFKRVQHVHRDRAPLLQKRKHPFRQRVTQLRYVDLQPQAKQRLDEDFTPGHYPGDSLSELKKGVQELGGIPFSIGDCLI